MLAIRRFVAAVLCASAWLSSAAVAQSTETVVSLTPAQIEALGLQTAVATSDGANAAARYPAMVVVPSGQQRVVAAPAPGLVEALNVSVGDSVRAGQPIGLLRSAQAQELQRDVLTTASQAALAGSVAKRDEQLYKEGLISLSRLEASRAQARQAQFQQQERKSALTQIGASVKSGGAVALVAPIDGVVLERPVVVGQRVEQTAPLFRIARLSPLWLEMQVPAREAPSVRIGDPVHLAAGAASGRVILVGQMVDDASQTVLVRAQMGPPMPDLRAGQAVEARIETSVSGLLVRVPSNALIDDAGRTVVFVATGTGDFRAVPVEAVSFAGNETAVRGLPSGSRVVVRATAALKAMLASGRP